MIRNTIEDFLIRYFWHILVAPDYHHSIALTNFRRWITCCELRMKFPTDGVTAVDPLKNPSMKFLYLIHRCSALGYANEIRLSLKGTDLNLEVDQIIMFDLLYKCAIVGYKPGLMDKLLEYSDIIDNMIQRDYGVKLPKGIKSGLKVFKIIS